MTTDQLISYFKTPKNIATFFNISRAAFYQWEKRPNKVIPKDRAIEAAFRTNSKLLFDESLYKDNDPHNLNNYQNKE